MSDVESSDLQNALTIARQHPVSDPLLPTGELVMQELQQMSLDDTTSVAALLSQSGLENVISIADIEEQYSPEVATLVEAVRWFNSFQPNMDALSSTPVKSEKIRRLLLAMSKDVRAVIIKLVFRLIRLRLLTKADDELRQQVASEALDIYCPIANRLGLAQLKWEMEDFSFRYLEPAAYKEIAKGLETRRADREQYMDEFKRELSTLLDEFTIDAEVSGRPKHIYSIWRKMRKKKLSLNELFDLHAIRVIVDDLTECYSVLGMVQARWESIPEEFDDYIAKPKPNGYRSLHSVVYGSNHKPVEIQIRTRAMHEFAELGVAAHWRYKEGGKSEDESLQNAIQTFRRLLDDKDNDQQVVDEFRTVFFPDKIFVLTPGNDVVELAQGSTPLDFAYVVHTEVGHRCRGAKVNGHIVALTDTLVSGDVVEILTNKKAGPSRDWMNPHSGFLKSAGSRGKVRHWFHQQEYDKDLESGHRILDQVKKRLHVKVKLDQDMIEYFHQSNDIAFFIAVGRGEIRTTQLEAYYARLLGRAAGNVDATAKKEAVVDDKPIERMLSSDLLTKVAGCCQPVAGDQVIGYITVGRGVTLHRVDCPNIINMDEEKKSRLLAIDWTDQHGKYPVDLLISAQHSDQLMNAVTHTLSSVSVKLLKSESLHDYVREQSQLKISVEVEDKDQLSSVIKALEVIKLVHKVSRVY